MAANSDQPDSDGIDYHVAFPVPKPETQDDDVEFKYRVVVLIGWLDLKDKYLSFYSKFYEEQGFTTLRYCPKQRDVVGARRPFVAGELIDVLIDLSLADSPVLFHVFSNGGSAIYQEMNNALLHNPKYSDITKLGVIYDSAPGHLRLLTALHVFVFQSQGSFWQKLVYFLKIIVSPFLRLLPAALRHPDSDFGQSIFEKICNAPVQCPELFLFSSADELILAVDIEEAIKKREAKGVNVSSKRWESSPHVQHLRYHKEEYIELCISFARKCIKKLL